METIQLAMEVKFEDAILDYILLQARRQPICILSVAAWSLFQFLPIDYIVDVHRHHRVRS